LRAGFPFYGVSLASERAIFARASDRSAAACIGQLTGIFFNFHDRYDRECAATVVRIRALPDIFFVAWVTESILRVLMN